MSFSRFTYVLLSAVCGLLFLFALRPNEVKANPIAPSGAGDPCALGTFVSADIICIHGSVWVEADDGSRTALDDALVTVQVGEQTLSSYTASPSGQLTPTYGIDIHSLSPNFLQTITVSAEISNTLIERSVILYPDFNTHNQQVDLIYYEIGGFHPEGIWGTVTPFDAAEPVAGAQVTLTTESGVVLTTTTVSDGTQLPSYQFDTSAIPAGTVVHVTAAYAGQADTRTATLGSDPIQLDFVTGWYCDGDNPFPDGSSGWGFPDGSSGWGFPDVVCFYGYVFADGVPAEDVDVYIQWGAKQFSGRTRYFEGESLPRYGIAVWEAAVITATELTVTAVQGGVSASKSAEIADDFSQRLDDISFDEPAAFASHTYSEDIRDLLYHGGYVWAATGGGVVRWDPTGNSYVKYTIIDGLIHHDVHTVAADPNGNLWFGTEEGISLYKFSETQPRWVNFTDPEYSSLGGGSQAKAFEFDDHYIYVASYQAVYRTPFANPQTWDLFSPTSGGSFESMVLASNNDLWVGRYANTIDRFDALTSSWGILTPTHGLGGYARALTTVDADLWIGWSGHGIQRYRPSTDEWQMLTTDDGLVNGYVNKLMHQDGVLWISTNSGASRYELVTEQWQSFEESDGLHDEEVRAMAVTPDGSVWFGTPTGISRLDATNQTWQQLSSVGCLPGNYVYDFAVAGENQLWVANRWDFDAIAGATLVDFNTAPPMCTTLPESPILGFPNNIERVDVAPNGDVWLGTHNGMVRYEPDSDTYTRFNRTTDPTINNHRTFDFELDNAGGVWAGTWNGLSYFDGTSWTSYTTTHGLPGQRVYDIEWDENGDLWLANHGGGVVHVALNGAEPVFTAYKELSNGVSLNASQHLHFDDNNVLWVAAGRLYRCEVSPTMACERIDAFTDTIYELEVDNNNDVWTGHQYGVVRRYAPLTDVVYEYTPSEASGGGRVEAMLVVDDTLWIGGEYGMTGMVIPKRYADLMISLDGATVAAPGGVATYTLAVQNVGDVRTTAEVGLTLPNGMTLAGAEPAVAAPIFPAWQIELAPHAQQTMTVSVALDSSWAIGDTAALFASATMEADEALTTNNSTIWHTELVDLYRADVGVSLTGPPLLAVGEVVTYTLWVDNQGLMQANGTTVQITLPDELSLIDAQPASSHELVWQLGTLASQSDAKMIQFAVLVGNEANTFDRLTVSAEITTTTDETKLANNQADAAIPTALTTARTLILTAPNRMVARYGASDLQARLYQLTQHAAVAGVVVDVMTDPVVADAYAAWDADTANQAAANQVADAIKQLITDKTIEYPNLSYLVLVGGDDIIPYYRVQDRDRGKWLERKYARQNWWLQDTTVGQALKENRILTDDFYADRTATVVTTPFYSGEVYLPDFAIGRLVETPTEIATVVDAFLATDGVLTLNHAIIGGDLELANDWQQAQCELANANGFSTPHCTTDGSEFAHAALANNASWLLSALHSDYYNAGGSLFATSVANSSLSDVLATMYGCHAGLNVAGNGTNFDLAQAFLGRGATYIGSTAYTYGGKRSLHNHHDVSLYTEELGLAFTKIVQTGTATVGEALQEAKLHYYTASASAFSKLDNKVTVGMTLYGLPMVQIATPTTIQRTANPPVRLMSSLPYDFDYEPTTTEYGTYYGSTSQLAGSSPSLFAKDGFPIQPQHIIEINATRAANETVRGVLLSSATYTRVAIDPVIAEQAAFDDLTFSQHEPRMVVEGYDHNLPYQLVRLTGLSETLADDRAMVVFNLGRHESHTGQTLIFDQIGMDALYSNSADTTPPTLISAEAITNSVSTQFTINAADDGVVSRVVVVADDGAGRWHSVDLAQQPNGKWVGTLEIKTQQYYVQLVDDGNNVQATDWIASMPGFTAVALSTMSTSTVDSSLIFFLIALLGMVTIRMTLWKKSMR